MNEFETCPVTFHFGMFTVASDTLSDDFILFDGTTKVANLSFLYDGEMQIQEEFGNKNSCSYTSISGCTSLWYYRQSLEQYCDELYDNLALLRFLIPIGTPLAEYKVTGFRLDESGSAIVELVNNDEYTSMFAKDALILYTRKGGK